MKSGRAARRCGWCTAILLLSSGLPATAIPALAAKPRCAPHPLSAAECAQFCFLEASQNAPVPLHSAQQASAQQAHNMQHMPGMVMPANPAAELLMQEATGTSLNPASAPMAMRMYSHKRWNFGLMANAFVTDTQQSGPRGGDKFFSTNVFMGSAERNLGGGAFLFDAMLSLEPATISGREYPELFQTGETAFGKPIENGQHPHNFVMSVGAHYAHPWGKNTVFEAYFAPVGDPSLGPIAYPHRASAAELPQAPLGHHWEDSTHISYEVATVAAKYKVVRLEISGFHGAEPGENRWNIGSGAMDSWAARFSVLPNPNWVAQVSIGRLTKPEALEPGDEIRTTASVEYSRPTRGLHWVSSFIFGRNHHTATGEDSNAFLLESAFPLRSDDFLTGRWERVDKDGLFAAEPALEAQLAITAGDIFPVNAYTLGYTHYVSLWEPLKTGIGANFTTYAIPSAIVPFYDAHPFGVTLYLHFILAAPGRK